MKGKNEEIIIAHHLDKLWMLPYFGTFSVFVNFSLLKKNCPRTLSMTGGPWTPGPCFFLSPIILVIITLILFRVNRWGECGRGKTITQFFSISFNRNEMLRCIFETWLFRRFQELSFNSIFYCSYSRNYLILTSNSLPADVLWGSFVTHSFSPPVPLPHVRVGKKWMRDERSPKNVCGGFWRARAIFSLSYPDSLLTETKKKNCLPCFIPCSAVAKPSRPNKAVPPARKSSLPAQPQPNSFFLSCQLEHRNYFIVRRTDFYSRLLKRRVLQRVNETKYALFLWCNSFMI